MTNSKWTSLATAALLVSAVALNGCGEDEPGSAPEEGSTPTSVTSSDVSIATAPNSDSFGDYSEEPRTFTSEVADVPFTMNVPAGWTALERDAGVAQFWEGEDEELSIAEVTISTDIQGSAADVRREFEMILKGSASSPVHRAEYGPYTVQQIDVREAPNGLPGGYRLPPEGEVTVVIFDVDGRGVTAYLDPFAEIEPPGQVARMLRQMRDVLQSIRFQQG